MFFSRQLNTWGPAWDGTSKKSISLEMLTRTILLPISRVFGVIVSTLSFWIREIHKQLTPPLL